MASGDQCLLARQVPPDDPDSTSTLRGALSRRWSWLTSDLLTSPSKTCSPLSNLLARPLKSLQSHSQLLNFRQIYHNQVRLGKSHAIGVSIESRFVGLRPGARISSDCVVRLAATNCHWK